MICFFLFYMTRRLAALENANSDTAGARGPSQPKKLPAKYHGLSPEDIAMAERLEQLKKDRKAGKFLTRNSS